MLRNWRHIKYMPWNTVSMVGQNKHPGWPLVRPCKIPWHFLYIFLTFYSTPTHATLTYPNPKPCFHVLHMPFSHHCKCSLYKHIQNLSVNPEPTQTTLRVAGMLSRDHCWHTEHQKLSTFLILRNIVFDTNFWTMQRKNFLKYWHSSVWCTIRIATFTFS